MRVVFAGTPAVAVPSLLALLESTHDVVGVLTRPPAPVGRKRVVSPSAVHAAADEAGVTVITSNRPHERDAFAALSDLQPDVCAVVAYGALLREPALSLPPHGWINLHFSILPAWRGAAPVQHAIIAGDEITGATTFRIETGLDTGPVLGTMTETIRRSDTSGTLLERLAIECPALLVSSLDAIADRTARPQSQPTEGVSLAPRLTSADGRIDWNQPATAIDRRIRGCSPAPGAWTTREGGRTKLGPVAVVDGGTLRPGQLRVTDEGVLVGTATDPVRLTEIAPPGKPWMSAIDWARGARLEAKASFDVTGRSG